MVAATFDACTLHCRAAAAARIVSRMFERHPFAYFSSCGSSVAASSHLSYTAMATLGSLGGLLSSLLTDHIGLLGIPKRRLSPSRCLGALLVLGGCCGASLDMAASQATVQSTLNPVAVAALGLLYLATSLVQPVQSCLSFRRA